MCWLAAWFARMTVFFRGCKPQGDTKTPSGYKFAEIRVQILGRGYTRRCAGMILRQTLIMISSVNFCDAVPFNRCCLPTV